MLECSSFFSSLPALTRCHSLQACFSYSFPFLPPKIFISFHSMSVSTSAGWNVSRHTTPSWPHSPSLTLFILALSPSPPPVSLFHPHLISASTSSGMFLRASGVNLMGRPSGRLSTSSAFLVLWIVCNCGWRTKQHVGRVLRCVCVCVCNKAQAQTLAKGTSTHNAQNRTKKHTGKLLYITRK